VTAAPVLLTATWAQSTDLGPGDDVPAFVRSARQALADGLPGFATAVRALAAGVGLDVRAAEAGIGFWPGGAEPTARLALTAEPDAARALARAIAAEFDQDAVQLVWPAPLPGTPDDGLRCDSVQVRHTTGDLATAEVLRRLAGSGVPGGTLLGSDLVVDVPAADAADVAAQLAGWLALVGWTRCRTERWGRDGAR
jgi:hypothetical protein